MMAKRIVTILPDLSFEESLEITKIYSIMGELKNNTGLISNRPFRSPHHTITPIGMIGGGINPKPGEITLAHNGVLFLDELPEFNRGNLEVLRSPLEDRKVLISRSNTNIEYPCNFMLVASMNPCPCGYLGDKSKACKCSISQIEKYKNRISGPLLDRIDMHIEVPNVNINNLTSKNAESSSNIRKRINVVREIQNNRYKEYGLYTNSELSSKLIEKYCVLSPKSKNILEKYFYKMNLSARSYTRILKISRTIADLDKSENIKEEHLLEALQYRCLDKRYN